MILALTDIAPGEEVTISYLNMAEEVYLDVRTERLRDYGFTCNCEMCQAERLSRELGLYDAIKPL